MKLICALIFLSTVLVIVSAEPGQYVPKGFYTIDENGHQSPMTRFNEAHQEKILHRLKRSPAFVSSSSSSTSYSNGGPVFFENRGSFVNSPGYGVRPKGSYTATTGYVDKNGRIRYSNRQGAIKI